MTMKLDFSHEAEKTLDGMDMNTAGRVLKAVLKLPDKGDIKPLAGKYSGQFRLRLADWRILFSISGDTLNIDRIESRGGVYK